MPTGTTAMPTATDPVAAPVGEPADTTTPNTEATTTAEPAKDGEKKPNVVVRQAVRTRTGVRFLGSLLHHWGLADDQGADEIRRRLVAAQLEAYTERRTEVEQSLKAALKKTIKLEEAAADGGLTQSQRQDLVLTREMARRLEKSLETMRKHPFSAQQPGDRQIEWSRNWIRVRRGTVLVAGAIATVVSVVQVPKLGLLEFAAAAGLSWWMGAREPRLVQRPVPAELLLPELAPPAAEQAASGAEQATVSAGPLFEGDTGAPFPIHRATDPALAAACVARALVAQQIDLAEITETVQTSVGWSMTVTVASGDPADIDTDRNAAAIRTLLKVPRGGLAVECWPDASDTATVRVQTRPAFTDMGPIPDHPALSNSIMDAGSFGKGLDGTELAFSLAGVMGFLVADSGGGKSSIMLALADWATSCRDAVVISIDPRGEGVEALGDAIQLAVSDDKHILKTLDWLDKLCEGRTRTRKARRYGKVWPVSPEHPAVVVFVDEWHDLPTKAKAKLLHLLRIGRKEAVWIIGASQFGTKEDLGSAIAPKMSLKMAGCCRGVDVTGLFGQGALREGYRADRLKPGTHTDPADAGTVYIQGLPGQRNRPMPWKFRHLTDSDATRRGDQRAEAGLPDLTVSAATVGLDWPALLVSLGANRPTPAPLAAGAAPAAVAAPSILDVIDAMNGERTIHTGPLLKRLAQARPEVYADFTADDLEVLLTPYGVQARQARAMTESEGTKNRTGYYLDDLQGALDADDDPDDDDLDEDDEA
ncbi:hypothetical protein [Kitasatospora sp. NPDC004272]